MNNYVTSIYLFNLYALICNNSPSEFLRSELIKHLRIANCCENFPTLGLNTFRITPKLNPASFIINGKEDISSTRKTSVLLTFFPLKPDSLCQSLKGGDTVQLQRCCSPSALPTPSLAKDLVSRSRNGIFPVGHKVFALNT